MNDIFEFFFCPVHGIFRMEVINQIIPFFSVALIAIGTQWRRLVNFIRHCRKGGA